MAVAISSNGWEAVYVINGESAGRRLLSVSVDCPGCGVRLRLDHEVATDGTIRPSLDCPLCPFHESGVRLLGWEP